MFKTRNIIFFLVGAAVVGFLLDQRRQRIEARTANNDVRTAVPVGEETMAEVAGGIPPKLTGESGPFIPVDLGPLDFAGAMT